MFNPFFPEVGVVVAAGDATGSVVVWGAGFSTCSWNDEGIGELAWDSDAIISYGGKGAYEDEGVFSIFSSISLLIALYITFISTWVGGFKILEDSPTWVFQIGDLWKGERDREDFSLISTSSVAVEPEFSANGDFLRIFWTRYLLWWWKELQL